ncbi:MAG: dicarboxylate/amino acid:cation symporter [Betaproteobacteria bacterium]
MKRMSLSNQIFLGMLIGIVAGLLIGPRIAVIQPIGDIFLNMIRMAIVPLLYFNVAAGVASMGDLRKLGRVGAKLAVFFLGTTAISTAIGVVVARLVRPGAGLVLSDVPQVTQLGQMPSFFDVLMGVFPVNVIQSMAQANMLQVIVFAIFSGVAILMLDPGDRDRLTGIFKLGSRLVLTVVKIVMLFSPIGVGALIAVTAGKYGASIFGPMAKFIGTVYAGLSLHVLLCYLPLVYFVVRIKPWEFIKRSMPVWMTSLSTCSTAATLPVSMRTAEEDFGFPKSITDFVIPVGATMNMDGNGLWFGVVAIFVTQIMGIEMSISQQVTAVFLGVAMTLGSPGIPGGIFVATTAFLTALGLPVEVVGLLTGIFRIMDMGITTVNVIGSFVGAGVISAIEKLFKRSESPVWDRTDSRARPAKG